jgi:uncharacterized protein (DUF1330 family)
LRWRRRISRLAEWEEMAMNWTTPTIAAAFVFGAVIGGAYSPTQPLKAAGMTPVYAIYEANVTDQDGYKNQFLSVLAPKLEKYHVKFLARGGKTQTLIGDEAKNRVVISQSTREDMTAFWNEAKDDFKMGQKYATGMRYITVEGVEQ